MFTTLVRLLSLYCLSSALSEPALVHVPVAILVPVPTSATSLVSIPASILRSFVHLYPTSRSRSITVVITVYVPVPAPDPDMVTPSVQFTCTNTGSCERSCRVPASATLYLQRGCRVQNESAFCKTKESRRQDVLLLSLPSVSGTRWSVSPTCGLHV